MKIIQTKLGSSNGGYLTSYQADDYRCDGLSQKHPAVIICPGGGWFTLSEREGEPVAMEFLQRGFQPNVLHYSLEIEQALSDMDEAVDYLKNHSEMLDIDPEQMILLGFSAGGQLAALYGNRYLTGIKAVVLCYSLCDMKSVLNYVEGDEITRQNKNILKTVVTVVDETTDPIRYVNENTPPTFLWHTADDELLPVRNTMKYAIRLSEQNIPFELHIYEHGVHGISLGKPSTAAKASEINSHCAQWFEAMMHWFTERKIVHE